MIEMENVCFTYLGANKRVLDGLHMTIKRNEVVLLLGASGAGKSSLAYCLNGLIPNSIQGELTGAVRVAGKNTIETPIEELTKLVGLVFQDPEAQLVTMRVEDEVAFGMENLCLDRAEMERRIEKALFQTGLLEYRKWPIEWLSGGQKQRLVLASVLCMQPQVLILDEPTANLDPEGTKEVFSILRQLKQSGEYTIIMIEHKLDDLMEMVDRVLVLGKSGRIIADGPPRIVFFQQYNELLREGIWLPYCVKLTCELKKLGLLLSYTPLTVSDTVEMLETILSTEATSEAAQTNVNDTSASFLKNEVVLEIKQVAFTHKRSCILQPMKLCVPQGDFLAIVGKNGAGKSTLARYIINLQQVNKGVIYLNGRDLVKLPNHDIVSEVGYVFQNPEHQFVTNCVADELAFGLKLLGISPEEVDLKVQQMLDRFGLLEYTDINPFQLSHGEKRRLSVASMLITGQKLLIFDEPTFGQDQQNAHKLMQIMKQLQEAGNTILMISHDMGLIAEYADHVAVMQEGRLCFHGTIQELFSKSELLAETSLVLPPSVQLVQRFAEQLPKQGNIYAFENVRDEFVRQYRTVQG